MIDFFKYMFSQKGRAERIENAAKAKADYERIHGVGSYPYSPDEEVSKQENAVRVQLDELLKDGNISIAEYEEILKRADEEGDNTPIS